MPTNTTTYKDTIKNKGVSLTEILGAAPIGVQAKKVVMLNMVNLASLDGEPSDTRTFAFDADNGAAAPATEGVDLTTDPTENGYEDPVQVVVTEAATDHADYTVEQFLRDHRNMGLSGSDFAGFFNTNNIDGIFNALGSRATMHKGKLIERAEGDMLAKQANLTQVAGDAARGLELLDLIDAKIQLSKNSINAGQLGSLLTPDQVGSLMTQLLNATGVIWGDRVAQGGELVNGGVAEGEITPLLGVRMFRCAEDLKATADAEATDIGSMFVLGNQTVPDAPGNVNVSPFVHVDGMDQILHFGGLAPLGRRYELVSSYHYGQGTLTPRLNNGVKFLSLAA